eukprot:365495-Chlamydomonas_euryale.AAC.11
MPMRAAANPSHPYADTHSKPAAPVPCVPQPTPAILMPIRTATRPPPCHACRSTTRCTQSGSAGATPTLK